MKYISIVIAAVLATGVLAYADAPGHKMVLNGSDGSKTEIPVSSIKSITFGGTKMYMITDGPQEFDVLKLDNIKFDMASAGESINRVFDDGVEVSINGGVIEVKSAAGDAINVAVYNLSGVCVMHTAGTGNSSVDMNPLAKGIYVVKANNKTIKYIR